MIFLRFVTLTSLIVQLLLLMLTWTWLEKLMKENCSMTTMLFIPLKTLAINLLEDFRHADAKEE